MRITAIVVFLISCSKAEPTPEPAIEQPPGTLRGTATSAMYPGVEPPPGTTYNPYPTTEPCDVVATDRNGVETKTRTNAKGEFELQLRPDRYTVSFLACMRSCNSTPVDPNRRAVVKSRAVERVDFHCVGAAP